MRFYTFVVAESDTEAIEMVLDTVPNAMDFDCLISSVVPETDIVVYTVSFSIEEKK